MKFLHLAALHLGKRVNGFDMLEDQRFILEQMLTLCEKHGVEAVVIAGDIYDTPVPPAAACTLLDWFLTQLAARRIPALAVSGTAYQGMFRNPMVSPDILGASTGAGFGYIVLLEEKEGRHRALPVIAATFATAVIGGTLVQLLIG